MAEFTWVEIYREIARKLVGFKDNQGALLDLIRTMKAKELPAIALEDEDAKGNRFPLTVMDPFSFYSNFNRGIRTESRIEMLRLLKAEWNLRAEVPADFSGIPVMNNQRAWFIGYQSRRGEGDVELLWKLFCQAVQGSIDPATFDAVLDLRLIKYNITMGLFWIDPERYLNLDGINRTYLEKHGITVEEPLSHAAYTACTGLVKEKFGKPFYQISRDAWLESNESVIPDTASERDSRKGPRQWVYAPGIRGEQWEDFHRRGILAIGWGYLGDLRRYANKEEIASAIRENENDPENSKKNDATACHAFAFEMKPGDLVFAKQGLTRLLGVGVVESDYAYDESQADFRHFRRVTWTQKGEWEVSDENRFPRKTLTDVTRDRDFVRYLEALASTPRNSAGDGMLVEERPVQYWWLNCNPKMWDISNFPLHARQTYTSHNSQGNKRRIYQYFTAVKPGDLVVGYVASPVRRIVALCKVTRGLHRTDQGEVFEFEKIDGYAAPVPLKALQAAPGLSECEPLINNQGSLFRLRPSEFDIIREIIDEANEIEIQQPAESRPYPLEEASRDSGFPIGTLERWVAALRRKKQAVFYGPPGTGKTFIAQRLASHLIGGTGGFSECLQFHPAYTYEEFMQGIRPDIDGKGALQFELKPGRFLDFCARARQRPGQPCVLILDEMNRGNLSRVFGELMYLLEHREQEMPLASGERFSIPGNVYIIGTMNTADRSIALVDFALRRRFVFFELAPEYSILKSYHQSRGFDASGLVSTLERVNEKIGDKNFHLGISFFITEGLKERLPEIWAMEIETYLEEYFFNQQESLEQYRWQNVKEAILT